MCQIWEISLSETAGQPWRCHFSLLCGSFLKISSLCGGISSRNCLASLEYFWGVIPDWISISKFQHINLKFSDMRHHREKWCLEGWPAKAVDSDRLISQIWHTNPFWPGLHHRKQPQNATDSLRYMFIEDTTIQRSPLTVTPLGHGKSVTVTRLSL